LTTPDRTASAPLLADTNTISARLDWAMAQGDTLFVAHSVNGYTKESKGQTGYVTAIDVDTGEMAWRSVPRVANAGCFAMVGGALVTGYGFTAEPDTLFVLDAQSGMVKGKVSLPSMAEEILLKEGRLYVRTYDHDLVFDVR
jgi:hypothetical protein